MLTLVWICGAQQKGSKSTSKTPAPVYKNLPVSSLKALADKGDREAQNDGSGLRIGTEGPEGQLRGSQISARLLTRTRRSAIQSGKPLFLRLGVPRTMKRFLKYASQRPAFIPAQFYLG